jgi:predicted RNA binding protein YcfA (HicA-like mRNA interferase family)
MAKDKERLLADLRRRRNSALLNEAVAVLVAWGFVLRQNKGHVQVWTYRTITLTVHSPHGKRGRKLGPGAVSMILRKIDEAVLLQREDDDAH